MANKKTTLKTQTGDNVYPNVLKENLPAEVVYYGEPGQAGAGNEGSGGSAGGAAAEQHLYNHILNLPISGGYVYLSIVSSQETPYTDKNSIANRLTGAYPCSGHYSNKPVVWIRGTSNLLMVGVLDLANNVVSAQPIDPNIDDTIYKIF